MSRTAAGLLCLLVAAAGQAQAPPPERVNQPVTLTVLFDNYPHDERLQTAWGFACLIQSGSSTVLFDTGGEGAILLGNMASLGFDPGRIDAVVLSHAHGDHTGGLAALLDTGARPVVYVPAALPASFKNQVRSRTKLVEVTTPLQILPGIHSTGPVGAGIVEQALVVESRAGLLMVTGCAHPGVVEMARACSRHFGAPPLWVIGGFHLGSAGRSRIAAIIADLRALGIRNAAPCHCSGELARSVFALAFGPHYAAAGAGWSISE